MWLNSDEKKKEIGRTLKIIDKKHQATFERAKFFSSVVQHAIGSLTDYEFEKETRKRSVQEQVKKEEAEEDVEDEEAKEDEGVEEEDHDTLYNNNIQPTSPHIFPPTSPIKVNPAHSPTSQPPPSPSPKEDRKEKGQGASSLGIPQHFSFSPSEQGAYVEPIIQYVDKAFFRYIKKHQQSFLVVQWKASQQDVTLRAKVVSPMQIFSAF